MLNSVVNCWNDLEKLLTDKKSDHLSKFKKLSKSDVEQMCNFLKPFKSITDDLGSSSVNICNVLPCMLKIRSLLQPSANDSKIVKEMKHKATVYFNEKHQLDDIHFVGTMLFPPLNNLNSFTDEIRSKGVSILRQKYNELSQQTAHNTESAQVTTTPYCKNHSTIAETVTHEDGRNELDRYLGASIPLAKDFDVLEWWHQHRNIYPTLYSIFLSVYCVPASSAASEREFSRAGNIIVDKRSSLNPSKVEYLMLSNRNADLIPKKHDMLDFQLG